MDWRQNLLDTLPQIDALLGAVRRIAVLGDMLELGPTAGELHADLAQDLKRADVDLIFTAGPLMARAFYASPDHMQGAHRANAAELTDPLLNALRDGDVVLVKGFRKIEADVAPEQEGLTLFHCHQQLHMDYGFKLLFDVV